jgi:hypothetical protein
MAKVARNAKSKGVNFLVYAGETIIMDICKP